MLKYTVGVIYSLAANRSQHRDALPPTPRLGPTGCHVLSSKPRPVPIRERSSNLTSRRVHRDAAYTSAIRAISLERSVSRLVQYSVS